jgi:hypothetical protein
MLAGAETGAGKVIPGCRAGIRRDVATDESWKARLSQASNSPSPAALPSKPTKHNTCEQSYQSKHLKTSRFQATALGNSCNCASPDISGYTITYVKSKSPISAIFDEELEGAHTSSIKDDERPAFGQHLLVTV